MILGKIKFIFFIIVLNFFNISLANDKITTTPLVNLENLKPSFEKEEVENESNSRNENINPDCN